jgi:hypothetical protein
MQMIDFWLQSDIAFLEEYRTKTQEVYEWACEMLSKCVSLRKLGVGISEETKEWMESGSVRGLEALKGMGLEGFGFRGFRDRTDFRSWPIGGLEFQVFWSLN